MRKIVTPAHREAIRAGRARFYELCQTMPAAEAAALVSGGGAALAKKPEKLVDPILVEIPADWQSLTWPERRSLAAKVSQTPVSTGPEVNAAIAAEVERRAAAAAA